MSEKTELVYKTDSGAEVKLSKSIVKAYLVSGDKSRVSDQEVVQFMMLCKYQGLNPFLREAYLVKYGNEPATIVTGKEAFTKRANKVPSYRGFEAGVYVTRDDGELVQRTGTLVLPNETLVGGWARVFRDGWAVPFEISVSLNEYEGKTKEGKVNRQWTRMPATMIRKVAIVQGLREAFPESFGGMYDSSEMGVSESDLPNDPVEPNGDEEHSRISEEIRALLDTPAFTKDEREATLSELEGITSTTTLTAIKEKLLKRVQEPAEDPDDVAQTELY